MQQTLFEKYGGVPSVTLIVRDFYKRVLKRPNLRRYFVNVKIQDLIVHQIAFVSTAMGKMPSDYAGRNMKEAHRGLGITTASFDLIVEIFEDALRYHEVTEEDVVQISQVIKKYKKDIVEK
jgi:hemoglobin